MFKKKKLLSRRNFIRSTAVSSAGVFLGLPAILTGKEYDGKDKESDYFVLIADTHIDVNPHELRNGTSMYLNLEIAVNRILNSRTARKPDGVILLGDIANRDGNFGEYAQAWTLLRHLSDAGIPVHFAMGNHDNRQNFYKIFPEKKPDVPLVENQHIEVIHSSNATHIVLDTLARVDKYITGGALGKEQLIWLDDALRKWTDRPVILYGHHYPWHNIQEGNLRGLKDYRELLEITYAHPNVKAYIFGHSHRLDPDPYDRLDVDPKGLRLFNVPTLAGHRGGQPVGYQHAFFHSGYMEFITECIDINEPWHGKRVKKKYRN